MWSYYRSCRRYSRLIHRLVCLFIISIFLASFWLILTTLFFHGVVDNTNDIDEQNSPSIFCFVLSSNDRHLTSSRAIVYSWGKRCDRFYFVTRLQNTSVDLMMIEHFENTSNITPMTITQQTLEVLIYLYEHHPYSSYHWFVRASDDSFVIMPNLRRLINQLHLQQKKNKPIVHVGDVDELYKKRQIKTTGSVMLFNRYALQRLSSIEESDIEKDKCVTEMIYDHEFVTCMKRLNIQINPINKNLILSQNLSFYKMDKQFKDNCCTSDTVAFRSSNETDMYKFDFLYDRLDALSKINI